MANTKPWPELPVGNKDHTSAAVVIIGAGVSGICQAIDLIRRNNCHNFVILEKSSSIGGTWSDNKYPGCCCDVWSLLYSYSFEQNPLWSREYPGQEEILAYLVQVAEKWNLYRYTRFNTNVASATWDDATKKWHTKVKIAEGTKDAEFAASDDGKKGEYTITSDFLVSAVGQLNMPQYPKIPGLDDFSGKLMHSARWDWTYRLEGKRVALIGNGATAAQIAPEVAKAASHLTIYQRTPNWVIMRLDTEVSPFRQTLQKYFPPVMWRIRAGMMDFRESFFDAVFDSKSDMAKILTDQCHTIMKQSFPDQPMVRDVLTPKYSIGCKRVIISDDYYPTIARDNVSLETRNVVKITKSGIEVEDAPESSPKSPRSNTQDYDLIVCATGFRTVEFMHPIKIIGKNSTPLSDVWKGGAKAYLGVTVPSLPNFAMLYGPNTNLGHNSIVLQIEAQSKYIATLVSAVLEARMRDQTGSNAEATMKGEGGTPIGLVPKKQVVDEYNTRIQAQLAQSSFADPNCNSWYKDPETGFISNNWSSTVIDYQKHLENVVWSEYEDGDRVVEMRNGKTAEHIPRVREESYISDFWLATLSGAAVVVGVLGWVGRTHGLLPASLKA